MYSPPEASIGASRAQVEVAGHVRPLKPIVSDTFGAKGGRLGGAGNSLGEAALQVQAARAKHAAKQMPFRCLGKSTIPNYY